MSTQTVSRETVESHGELYMSFELGDKKWKLTASDGHRAPSRYNVDAGDTATVAYCIAKAPNRCKLGRRPECTAATKPDATAGGSIVGCANKAPTTSWSTPAASR